MSFSVLIALAKAIALLHWKSPFFALLQREITALCKFRDACCANSGKAAMIAASKRIFNAECNPVAEKSMDETSNVDICTGGTGLSLTAALLLLLLLLLDSDWVALVNKAGVTVARERFKLANDIDTKLLCNLSIFCKDAKYNTCKKGVSAKVEEASRSCNALVILSNDPVRLTQIK